jgi:hypothetical protein
MQTPEHETQKMVVGTSAYSREASWSLVALSAWGELMVGGILLLAAIKLLSLGAAPHPLWPLGWALGFAVAWFGQRAAFGVTLGERTLGLRPGARFGRPLRTTQIDPGAAMSTGLLLLGATAALGLTFHRVILRHPLWAATEAWELDAYLPDMASGDWKILPFFYSLAAWPARFEGRPVLHQLPYEKGPPSRFIGHLIARWDPPQFNVAFEGPKTPIAGNDRATVRGCLASGDLSVLCLKMREVTLKRHLDEMGRRFHDLRTEWKLRWFEVKNAALPPEEQAQGIYVEASREGRQLEGEARFIVITRNGTHQAFIFSWECGSRDALAQARKKFEQSIRSLRASDSLVPGRAWIDRELGAVQMERLAAGGVMLEELAPIQALLVAKITLDPAVFEAYFHLAGTSLLMMKAARGAAGGASTERALDVATVARPNIQSALKYAQDVAPAEPRIAQLQGIAIEAKK